ncbi:glycine betaine ABC transporter substrate-binding protein [Arthrobacter wenxiniae]|uniref:Glycine/betaine ABC transporter substrate-binding protein n=1 Tax=Arthrobacter wenxiniae TaxID=2713570 RepID=A0A7Y7IJB3_9MICC|nr:glycine betaine ABC transporter substrate-binding protein [Arthrobacter wenxiniae]NVM96327.1 glycine/betaine ABC transporter substrate-binding protein [Arthrobacter wenxiniae]
MRLKRLAAVAAVASLLFMGATACTPSPIVVIPSATQSTGPALEVGTPAVPDGASPKEGELLANVYAAALNAAGLAATVKAEDPQDPTVLGQLAAGTVDVAPGYSSAMLLQLDPSTEASATGPVLDALKAALPTGTAMLDPAKAEDNDSLVVTAVTAEKYHLKTIADLAKVCGKLDFGGSAAFRAKGRGLSAVASDYDCVPKSYRELPSTKNELLLALLRDDIQVADIHSSSPAIDDNALVTLTDTKGIFRPETVVPVINADKVSKDVQAVLNKVTGALSGDELVNLNRIGSGSHFGSPAQVAHAWLVQKGLLKATS